MKSVVPGLYVAVFSVLTTLSLAGSLAALVTFGLRAHEKVRGSASPMAALLSPSRNAFLRHLGLFFCSLFYHTNRIVFFLGMQQLEGVTLLELERFRVPANLFSYVPVAGLVLYYTNISLGMFLRIWPTRLTERLGHGWRWVTAGLLVLEIVAPLAVWGALAPDYFKIRAWTATLLTATVIPCALVVGPLILATIYLLLNRRALEKQHGDRIKHTFRKLLASLCVSLEHFLITSLS